jgi:hypothetical protein
MTYVASSNPFAPLSDDLDDISLDGAGTRVPIANIIVGSVCKGYAANNCEIYQ